MSAVDRRLEKSFLRSIPSNVLLSERQPKWPRPSALEVAPYRASLVSRRPWDLAESADEPGGFLEPIPAVLTLSPRLRQTLSRLLEGKREKQIAAELGLSPATVHEYVRVLYRRFGVSSRAELSARFLVLTRRTRADRDVDMAGAVPPDSSPAY